MNLKVKCPVCKDDVPIERRDGGPHVLKNHGKYVLGAKKPYTQCKGSGVAIRTELAC